MGVCVFIPVPCYVQTVLELIFLSFAVILVVWFTLYVPITYINIHAVVVHKVLCKYVAKAGKIFTISDVYQVGYTLSLRKAQIKVTERLPYLQMQFMNPPLFEMYIHIYLNIMW